MHSNRSLMMIKKDNYHATDCTDNWCGISKVVRGLPCKLHRNTSIMHHIVALYRINIHIYSEIVIW